MEPEVKKEEAPKEEKKENPGVVQKQTLENRLTRLNIIDKIETMKKDRVLEKIEIEEEQIGLEKEHISLEQEQIRLEQIKTQGGGFFPPIMQLMILAESHRIDNDKCLPGSEPAIRSMWDDDEIQELKSMIMKKARKL